MSVDDPGWEGYSPFGQETPNPATPQPVATPAPDATGGHPGASGYDEATGYDEPNVAPPPGSGYATPDYTPPASSTPAAGHSSLPRRNLLIGGGGLLLVALIVVIALVAGGGGSKKPIAVVTPVNHSAVAVVSEPATTPTAAAPTSPTAAVTPPIAPASPTDSPIVTGNISAALLSVVPDGFAGACEAEPKVDWLSPTTSDEVACLTQSVPNASAVFVGIARQQTADDVTSTFDNILKLNGFKADTGACAAGSLAGTTATGSYCESAFAAADGTMGREILYDGSRVNVGGNSGETTTFCQEAYPGSQGVSVVIFTNPGEHNIVVALNCNPAGNLLSGLQNSLVNGVYDLTD